MNQKPRKKRAEILQFLVSQNCTSAYDGLVDNKNTSAEYAKIATEEIAVYLSHFAGWKVIGCGQQTTRRDWKKYHSDKNYRAEIDKKQRMAKHYVLFQQGDSSDGYRVLLINGHKGNTAAKLYCGKISEDSNIYGVQFKELLHFVSIKHTHDNVQNLRFIAENFCYDIDYNMGFVKKPMEESTMTKEEFEKQLLSIVEIPKKIIIKGHDLVKHFYDTKQDVWGYTYYNLLSFATDTLVNHYVRSRSSHTIASLEQHARLAMKIREYVIELMPKK